MADVWGIVGIIIVGLLVLGVAFVMFLFMKRMIDSKLGKKGIERKDEEKKN